VSVREVLRHRRFAYLVGGRTVSLVGNGLAGLAIAFAVLDLTGSTTDLGLVLAARSVPLVVFMLFGGVLPTGSRVTWCWWLPAALAVSA